MSETFENPSPEAPKPARKLPKLLISLSALLGVIIIVMVLVWKPWEPSIKATERTIEVTGNADITAAPDKYVFSPSYDFPNANQQTALNTLSQKSNDIVTQLKKLGVANSDIQTNASGAPTGIGYIGIDQPLYKGDNQYTLTLNITVHDQSLAQKVEDYLITTTPNGDITPDVSFSTAEQHTLQTQARNKAEEDARSQADQSAKNLGFKVDKVKTVTDNSQNSTFPQINNAGGATTDLSSGAQANVGVPVQPGQNDYTYSVDVIYYIH